MRIGILGTGTMAGTLGEQWTRAGHQVMLGGRSAERATTLAEGIGALPGGLREAAAFGDVTLLAVAADGTDDTLAAAGAADGSLTGRPLIDCTNALVPGRFVLARQAVAERVASLAIGAEVVKAFNLCAAEVWAAMPLSFEATPLAVPMCGDDAEALRAVGTLVSDLGATPVVAGGLDRAALLEATAAFVIGMWATGGDLRAAVPPLSHAFGPPAAD